MSPKASAFAKKIQAIVQKGRAGQGRVKLSISDAAALELARVTELCFRIYARDQKTARPSEIARRLGVIAKALRRGADGIEAIGRPGLMHLLSASNFDRTPENFDPDAHVVYLNSLACWACRATTTATRNAKSSLDDRGGPTRDEALRKLIRQLADRFETILAIEPKHTIDPEDGASKSLFDRFISEALRDFAPADWRQKPRAIDNAIRGALKGRRGVVAWEPPPFN